MSLAHELVAEVNSIVAQPWGIRDGDIVPDTDGVALTGGGVKLNGTVLYADLADSTSLAMLDKRLAARVFKIFLACCTRIIRAQGGEIRSFDGDRVMGVFIGNRKNTTAALAALHINYACRQIIKPKLEATFETYRSGGQKFEHCVGVDTSEVLVVRAGIRRNNDLVWVGRAPNYAAKLTARG